MQEHPILLHFGTARAFLCKARGASVPRLLHLNTWIPAFAESTPQKYPSYWTNILGGIRKKCSGGRTERNGKDGVAWKWRNAMTCRTAAYSRPLCYSGLS